MRIIEKDHQVDYIEPWQEIPENDVLLYWEAPCTINSKDGEHYKRIKNYQGKKILLFAGGPIQKPWVEGFDLVCVESAINKKEFDDLSVLNITAFGINDRVMTPKNLPKIYDGMHHATSASWKRQWLMAEALGNKALVVGRFQETDSMPFIRSRELGATIMEEQSAEVICDLLNQSYALIQTSEYWGGGQRATLEAMACDVPVICMTDSPKNREYIEESGVGLVVDPDPNRIREAVEMIKANPPKGGRKYIESKWTAKHYADNLLKGINITLNA
jgi:glycosyltransferase involved in cell wall biosynthesis